MSLPKKYQFKNIEEKYNNLWSENETYKWKGSKTDSFVIDTPPPTISGQLHMGHIFSYCHTDFIARYQRMIGKDVFYPIGFDDNGLPTERLVEKNRQIRATDLERSEFNKICSQVSYDHRQDFKALFKSIGISYDWSLEYHTISKEIQALSQMSFIDLYKKQAVYRQLQPVLWDTVDQTAIAQAEIEDKDMKSFMNTIIFSTELGQNIHIATTRPELLPACVAVFCHPEDNRYRHLINSYAIVPIFHNKVKILPDDKVKMDKGTGLVMCCTFGDDTDVYWWRKYNLDTKIIIDTKGKIYNLKNTLKNHPISNDIQKLEGLSINNARVSIIETLEEKNLLVEKKAVIHSVKCAERSGSPLEILLNYQWFIKVLDQKQALLEKVNQIDWYPKSMKKRMEIWINGLSWDWCISRQRYFGVPFPLWYSKKPEEQGKVILPNISQLPIDPLKDLPEGYSRDEVIAESDVMDTWATSSISPQFHTSSINKNTDKSFLFPADLRPQSHEIIRTWAFYTILKSHYHNHSIPWKNIMISGWCLSQDKTKMSKSKGNVITPKSIIDSYGADVVRYWAANSRLGTDTVFNLDTLKIGSKLINKIWNAGHFVLTFIKEHKNYNLSNVTEVIDQWIISKLYKTIINVTEKFNTFEYSVALNYIEEFFWKNFCDNYLEIVKKRAYGEQPITIQENLSAINTLSYTLNILLRLFAPFLPYITEKIFCALYNQNSIHQQNYWPTTNEELFNENSYELGNICIEILEKIRKIKSERQVSIKYPIKTLTVFVNEKYLSMISFIENDLKAACNTDVIKWDNINNVNLIIKEQKKQLYISVEFS